MTVPPRVGTDAAASAAAAPAGPSPVPRATVADAVTGHEFLAAAGSKLLEAALDSIQVLERAAELAVRFLADICSVQLIDHDGVVRRVAVRHADPTRDEVVQRLQEYPISPEHPTMAVFATGQPLLFTEITPEIVDAAATGEEHRRLVESVRPTTGMIVPLIARGRTFGTIGMARADSERRYGNVELKLAQDLATRTALAFDNARLYEAERTAHERAQAARERLTFTVEVSSLLAESLSFREALGSLARMIVGVLSDVCLIDVLHDNAAIERVAAVHADPARQHLADLLWKKHPDANGPNPAARVIASGRPDYRPEITPEFIRTIARDDQHLEAAIELAPASYMTLPLIARRRVIGAITLITTAHSGRRFDAEDVELGQDLARRAALLLDNTRLYEEASYVANALQKNLLATTVPDIPGTEVAVRYIAAARGADVGGDWYDVFAVADGSVAVTVGDVVGRGVRAAAKMGQLRTAVRAFALNGRSPSRLVGDLNALLESLGTAEMAATLFLALYDPRTRALRYTNAGHPPPLVADGHGTRRLTGGLTTPIGVPTAASEAEARLEPGATLLLYTDGLVERRQDSVADGIQSLQNVFERYRGLSVEDLSDKILEEMLASDDGLPDDIALLALRPTG